MPVGTYNRFSSNIRRANDEISSIERQKESMRMVRGDRKEVVVEKGIERHHVRKWMRDNVADYDNETELVEGLMCSMNIPEKWLKDETHWIWDIAVSVVRCHQN